MHNGNGDGSWVGTFMYPTHTPHDAPTRPRGARSRAVAGHQCCTAKRTALLPEPKAPAINLGAAALCPPNMAHESCSPTPAAHAPSAAAPPPCLAPHAVAASLAKMLDGELLVDGHEAREESLDVEDGLRTRLRAARACRGRWRRNRG
eukprot:3584640-Prymnesium_polylepis.1